MFIFVMFCSGSGDRKFLACLSCEAFYLIEFRLVGVPVLPPKMIMFEFSLYSVPQVSFLLDSKHFYLRYFLVT